jgi:2-polyprenyl-3-methyl-5-hydroxy-6-metoxy-1,4-benzoquinol methylase
MYNRILNSKDVEVFIETIQKENYVQKFPPTSQWDKDCAILKTMSVLDEIKEIGETSLKIIDLGAAAGALPHIVSEWGNDVIAIDMTDMYISQVSKNTLVKMVTGDVFIELKEMDEESVDVITDVCAVTHFDYNYTETVNNLGWKKVSDDVYRVLKKGGRFIVSTDCDVTNERGQFISPESLINIIESSGLQLTSPYQKEYEDTDCYTLYNGMILPVVCLAFEKK